MKGTHATARTVYRRPTPADAGGVWRLVKDSGSLDANSAYCYMLLFRHFADTCQIAERDGDVVGFVTAFVPPADRETLFVWQIAVAPETRGQGVGGQLLRALLRLPAAGGVSRLEATVSPGNAPSRRLFEALARERGTVCERTEGGYPAEAFPEPGHEAEPLLRVRLLPAGR